MYVPSSLATVATIVRHEGTTKHTTPITRSRIESAPEFGPGKPSSTSAFSTDDGEPRTQSSFAYKQHVSSWFPQLTSLFHAQPAGARFMPAAERHVMPSRLNILIHRSRSRIRHRTGNTPRQSNGVKHIRNNKTQFIVTCIFPRHVV